MTDDPYPDPDGEPELDLGGIQFFDRLEDDLVAAARRRAEGRVGEEEPPEPAAPRELRGEPTVARPRRRRGRQLVVGAAATAIAVAAGASLLVGGGTADAVSVQRTDTEILISFDEAADDARTLEEELRAEGIAASVADGLAPGELDGRVLVVATTGDESDLVIVDRDDDGVIDAVRLPVGWSGTIELVVGRSSGDGEATFAARPAECSALVDRPLADVLPDLRALSPAIVWERDTTQSGGTFERLEDDRIDLDDTVVDLLVEPDGTLRVLLSPTPDEFSLAVPPCAP
ncbi:MAG: hypothetical protein AAGA99_01160 [Actinomycetota bacterium]